jgi:hypothetical protein
MSFYEPDVPGGPVTKRRVVRHILQQGERKIKRSESEPERIDVAFRRVLSYKCSIEFQPMNKAHSL